jgi:hypothetical protein
MWIAVRQRFRAFHADLTITQQQIDDGFTKATGVSKSLQRAYFPGATGSAPAFLVGSWGKRTQVRPPQDIDMMMELPADVYHRFNQRVGNSQSGLLQEVKENLLVTYSTSTMRGDGQVVQIRFNTVMVEILPVFRLHNGQFLMPDTNGGGRWKTVDPFAEQNQLDALDRTCNGNVRAMCQMLKVWKRENNVPLKSFQIELLVQEFMNTYKFREYGYFYYDWFMRDFFKFLVNKAGSYVVVPGTGETVWLGRDWTTKAERAHETALRACECEYHDHDITGGQEWQKIFGSRIPVKVI